MPLTFFKDFGSAQTLQERKASILITILEQLNLLVDQVEFANVIILNKTDLRLKKELEILKASIQN
jgi:G3E family GTPase